MGGPIKKNKLFFFLGYQGTLDPVSACRHSRRCSHRRRAPGDFPAYESQCFDTPQNVEGALREQHTPAFADQSAGARFRKPLSVEPRDACGNVTFAEIANQDEHMGLAKVDYQISSKQSFFARYFGTHSLTPSSFTGTELSVQNAGTDDEVNTLVLGHTYVFSPNALNTFHATLDRDGITKFQVPIPTPTDIGVQNIYTALPNFSNINITGDFMSAGGFATPGLVNTTTYQFFGRLQPDQGLPPDAIRSELYSSHANHDVLRLLQRAVHFLRPGYRHAMADFVAGQLDSFTDANISHDNEKWAYLGLYAQDNWKINSRLTLNYGLRWEPYLNGRIVNNKITHFNMQDFLANVHSTIYPNAPAGTLFPGDPGFRPADGRTRPPGTIGRRASAWRGTPQATARRSFEHPGESSTICLRRCSTTTIRRNRYGASPSR